MNTQIWNKYFFSFRSKYCHRFLAWTAKQNFRLLVIPVAKEKLNASISLTQPPFAEWSFWETPEGPNRRALVGLLLTTPSSFKPDPQLGSVGLPALIQPTFLAFCSFLVLFLWHFLLLLPHASTQNDTKWKPLLEVDDKFVLFDKDATFPASICAQEVNISFKQRLNFIYNNSIMLTLRYMQINLKKTSFHHILPLTSVMAFPGCTLLTYQMKPHCSEFHLN